MTTIFDQIISGKIPSKKLFENERILAIVDIHPIAPVHILIMPKKSIRDLQSIESDDLHLIGEIVAVAKELARELHLEEGYRLLTNNGPNAGQTIHHLHFHLIGGRKLKGMG